MNSAIRLIYLASGVVTTIAGTVGVTGTANGQGSNAKFKQPWGIAMNPTATTVFVVREERAPRV